jgi:hypothetical protein
MKLLHALIVFILLGIPLEALAQTACPQGVPPGDPRCGPGGSGGGGWDLPAGKVYTRWKSTWGAIAEDGVAAVFGASTGEPSRRAASRAAVDHCKQKGGKACKLTLAFKNSCVVLADPVELLPVMNGISQSAETIEAATKMGLAACSKANGGHACKIIYSNCTAPNLIHE